MFFALPTLETGCKSRAIDRADVVIFRVVDGVVKGHRLHDAGVWPGRFGRVVQHALPLFIYINTNCMINIEDRELFFAHTERSIYDNMILAAVLAKK